MKAVLSRTKTLGWGTDAHFYETPEAFEAEFPRRLREDGPRVIKRNRSNGGFGVWRIIFRPDGAVEVLSARTEDPPRTLALEDFLAERRGDFGGGGIVD